MSKVAKKYVIAKFLPLYDKWTQILTENGVFYISKPISRSFELFPQRSCQVVYHRPLKLPETLSVGHFFPKKLLDLCEMS